MKKLLGVASAIAILAASGSAFAQAPAAPGMAPAAPMAAPAADVSVDLIVAALNDPQAEIGKLSSAPADAQIQVVDLATYLSGDGAATLNPAITSAEGQGEAIRQALESNSAIQAQLTAQNVNIADVVGFGVDGSTILVFTNASANAGGAGAAGGAAAGGGGDAPAAPAPAAQ